MACNHIEQIQGRFEGVDIDTMEWLEAGWLINHAGIYKPNVWGNSVPRCRACNARITGIHHQAYMQFQYALTKHIEDLT